MTPILLITGFLGSGKTTFVNWLLASKPDLKISVILNEFGDIKLESFFVKQRTNSVMELANGCLCCVAKSDIPRAIRYVLSNSPDTEYLIIEASGLSDPDPVRAALQSSELAKLVYLDSTVCLVDTTSFSAARTAHPIINAQLAETDIILLNKTQLTPKDEVQQINQLLKRMLPDIQVWEFADNLSADIFLPSITMSTSVSPNRDSKKIHQNLHHSAEQNHNHQHDHTDIHSQYQTFWYQTNKNLNIDQLLNTLKLLPTNILRVKGIVVNKLASQIANQTTTVLVQKVGKHVQAEQVFQTQTTQTTILFIGTNLETKQITNKIDSCQQKN